MDRGQEFLEAQVNNAVGLHKSFLSALESHGEQAEDLRYRELCNKYLPMMREHQSMLESYQTDIGGEGAGTFKKAMGAVLGKARDLADAARESDFLRLVNDIVMSRQLEDTYKTFREAGKQLGLERLAEIGDMGERDHDSYNRDANRLIQQLFVEHVREGEMGDAARTRRIPDQPRPVS